MEFIKKHYEKILLALVLLGLMGSVVYLLLLIPQKREEMKKMQEIRLNPVVTPLAVVKPEFFNLNADEAVLRRADAPLKLDFTTGHNLFNPVLWLLMPPPPPGGKLNKITTGNEIGPGALVVTAINPIYLIVSATTNLSGGSLLDIYEEVPGSTRPVGERHTIINKDTKNDLFNVLDISGPDENPKLSLEFKTTQEKITVSYDQPFRRVAGYTADLKYPPDPNAGPWLNKRANPVPSRASMLQFADGVYFLVEVAEDHVVILSEANKKKTPIYFHPATH